MATHFGAPIKFSGTASGYKALKEAPMGFSATIDSFGFFDDFVRVDDDQTNDWTVVKDTGASVGISADTQYGVLNLTSAATTDNDGASIQGNEIFKVTAGKNIYFCARIQCNDADQTDIDVGLTVNFATNPEAITTAADQIIFRVVDGDASILCYTEKDGTATSTDSGVDLADSTWVKLEILVESTNAVKFFINGSLVATHTTNIPDDEELTVAAASVSGSATGTRATLVDYIGAFQER